MGIPSAMRALWLEDGELRVRDDVPVPDPPSGEALVRVLRAGVCNTDLELVRGYVPFTGVPGHEFVGRVVEGPEELEGRRVVGEINAVCGECRHCRQGRRTHCERRTVLGIVDRHGAFSEYLSLPVENLHPVPSDLSTDHATFTEPLAAALEIREQVRVGPGDRVLVVGDGKLGLLVAQSLALTGCDLTTTGHHRENLALLEARGVRTLLTATSESGTASPDARDGAPEVGAFDVAVEVTGSASGFREAVRALRPRGTLVMKSTYAGELTLDAAEVVVNELTLVGSRCGPFPPALRLLTRGDVEVEPMIHARYGLERGIEAFRRAGASGVLKVLLEME